MSDSKKADLSVSGECRDLRHAWIHSDGGREGRGWWRSFQCQRCKTIRTEHLTASGEFKRDAMGHKLANYTYPEGYVVPGGISDKEMGKYRLSWLKQH